MTRQRLQTIFILTVFLCTSWTTPTFRKGCSGTYYISGTAYRADKTIIKSAGLTVKFGKDTKIVRTDSNGQYEISVHWDSACPSGLTGEELKKENERINPQFIYITYADNEIKLENKWEKYADCSPASKDEVTWKKDLHF